MFFIFGWGGGDNTDLGPTLPIVCPNCHNDTVWHLHERKSWFTIFFVPLFPYQSMHFFACPICSRGIRLVGEPLDHARRLNAAASAYTAGTISEAEFKAILGSAGPGGQLLLAQSIAASQGPDATPVARCPDCGFNSFNGNLKVCPECHTALEPVTRHELGSNNDQ